jgi:DNA-directed RNA polymerase subunit alpha
LPNVVAVATAPNYGRFAVGPVEAGIGVTLGNALRRILLSSLPGSAITSVRIQNVYHEFSCIPNVREDVTEIVLNIKNIRLRSYSERAVRLNLAKHGAGEVRAGDIELPANVELVNPDLVLATLDGPDAHLELELTVERGRGYVSFEAREGMPIGTIPVDAIFSPIPKVNYLVEPADADTLSVVPEEIEAGSENGVVTFTPEEVEGREQLLIEIWTDGTIDPGEALSLSAQYLFQHSQLISGFNKQAATTSRDLPGAVSIPAHLFEMPIEDLSLSMRTYNCLKRSGVTKVGQVLRMDKKELLGLRNFGDKSFDELHLALLSRDLIPPGTPLDLSAAEDEGEEGAEGESDTGETIGYGEYDQADEPDVFMMEGGETADHDVPNAQVVNAAGVSEGTLEAAAGIYIDDEPASEVVDVLPDDHEADLGQAEAAPKARSRKKS